MRRDEINLSEPPNNDRPGDRWTCGRTGEPCARGPIAPGLIGRGHCGSAEPCRPRRTWYGWRKHVSLAGMLVIVGLLALALRPATRASVLKPGELSTPHAQILAGTLDSGRCAACHPQAADFLAMADHGVRQSDRCLDCHHQTIDRTTAMLAHNISKRVRGELRLASLNSHNLTGRDTTWRDWLPSAAVDQEDVQCSACHREHRGANASLTSMSNDQCQTCHSDRFGSFADSHPTWNDWPYGRGGVIAFDHASHANKHFPLTVRDGQPASFACGDCHHRDSGGELTRSVSYEISCERCHDAALRLEAAGGVELLTLPTLAAQSAKAIGDWPSGATGFYDGRISAMADLLMRVDADVSVAMRSIPDRNFANINEQHNESERHARTVAIGHRDLIESISRDGQAVVVQRLKKSGIDPSTARSILRSLPPQLIEESHRRWFGVNPNVVERRSPSSTPAQAIKYAMQSGEDDLLGDLSGDDLLGDPLAADPLDSAVSVDKPSSNRYDADAMLPAGGWYRDDLTFSIRYRGGGHDDPVLKSMIDMAAQLAPGDPARTRLLETKSIAACLSCHPGAMTDGYVSTRSWMSQPLIDRNRGFTKFAHSPHLNIAGLSDCRHCHAIETQSTPTKLSTVSLDSHPQEFSTMGIATCAGCHQPKAAGDACVKCHRYHVETPTSLPR